MRTLVLNKYPRITRCARAQKYVTLAQKNTDMEFPAKVSPHVLRHSKAVHMLQSGVNLMYIRDFLGHSGITTTQIYARVDTETRRRALEATRIPGLIPDGPSWTEGRRGTGTVATPTMSSHRATRPSLTTTLWRASWRSISFRHHRRNWSHLHVALHIKG